MVWEIDMIEKKVSLSVPNGRVVDTLSKKTQHFKEIDDDAGSI